MGDTGGGGWSRAKVFGGAIDFGQPAAIGKGRVRVAAGNDEIVRYWGVQKRVIDGDRATSGERASAGVMMTVEGNAGMAHIMGHAPTIGLC